MLQIDKLYIYIYILTNLKLGYCNHIIYRTTFATNYKTTALITT